MKNKINNRVTLSGYLYDHDLEERKTGATSKTPNMPYIRGDITIATDDELLNTVKVHYSYVPATRVDKKTGKTVENAQYTSLMNIINGIYKTYLSDSNIDTTTKLTVSSTIGLNDFYTDHNGEEELVSVKINDGGFIHTVTKLSDDLNERNSFEVDMVITNVKMVDATENTPEKLILKGAIFNNFTKALLPTEFSVVNPKAFNHFESLEVSSKNPQFCRLRGKEVSTTVVRTIVEEGAFDDYVREVKTSSKDWVVTWTTKEPYVWGEEDTITSEELKKAMQDREVYLASVKKNREEYKAAKNGNNFDTPKLDVASDDEFDF